MASTETMRQLEEHLACAEAQVGEVRRILVAGLPCDRLLGAIGTVQVTLEHLAAAVHGLCGERCQIRLTPDEFQAEFEQTFTLRISGCRRSAYPTPE